MRIGINNTIQIAVGNARLGVYYLDIMTKSSSHCMSNYIVL